MIVYYTDSKSNRKFQMSGYSTILKIQRLEEEINSLGFRWGHSKTGGWSGNDHGDVVALYPKGDCLPIYSRDAELFTGTIEQLQYWLAGYKSSRNYDYMLMGKSVETKRTRKEQDYRNQMLMRKIAEAGSKDKKEA